MSSGIPGDSNFRNLSSQLGGFRLNGNVSNQTAQSLNVVTIDDSEAAQTLTKSLSGKFLQVTVGQDVYYLPLYS
jgi:hypothetical protein